MKIIKLTYLKSSGGDQVSGQIDEKVLAAEIPMVDGSQVRVRGCEKCLSNVGNLHGF